MALAASLSLFLCQAVQVSCALCSSNLPVPLPLWATWALPSIRALKVEVATFVGFPSDPKYSRSLVILVAIYKNQDIGCWHD